MIRALRSHLTWVQKKWKGIFMNILTDFAGRSVFAILAVTLLQSCGPTPAELSAQTDAIDQRYDYLVGQSYAALERKIGAPDQRSETDAGTVYYYNEHYQNTAFEAGYSRVYEQKESAADRLNRSNVNADRALIGSPFAPGNLQVTLSPAQARRDAERWLVCGLQLTVDDADRITKVQPRGRLWKTPGLTALPSSCADRLDKLVSYPGS